jgi:hypothetical protein
MFSFQTLKFVPISTGNKLIVAEINVAEVLAEQRTNNKWEIYQLTYV